VRASVTLLRLSIHLGSFVQIPYSYAMEPYYVVPSNGVASVMYVCDRGMAQRRSFGSVTATSSHSHRAPQVRRAPSPLGRRQADSRLRIGVQVF
jgi:hypothetical protein